MNSITLLNRDCFEILPKLPPNSIDMILCDLPYCETGNKWDKAFDIKRLAAEYERLIKEDGAICLHGTFKFGVCLFTAMPHLYKYDYVWEKDNGTNIPNVNYQPFRVHEMIYVFGKGRVAPGNRTPMKYNPQKTDGKAYQQKCGRMSTNWKGGLNTTVTDNTDGKRHPKTVQRFNRDKHGLHPTAKPVELLKFLIKTYTNENDVVLDNCMGSGSTGVACKELGRRFIGIENDTTYFKIAEKRIEDGVGIEQVNVMEA
jgi:site-specific DNA-methyltransferase (adenine-specific)